VRSIHTAAVLRGLALVGTVVGALALAGFAGLDESSPEAAGLERSAAAAGPGWQCAPGPERLSDMGVTPGGYPKARARDAPGRREFHFTRAMYTDNRWGGNVLGDGGPAWSIDYPLADRVMVAVATRLSNLDACVWENPISLADPDLRRFPFLYSLEWGFATLTEAEVEGLRGYLLAGGFLMLDDFWGTAEWASFERQMRRVFPDRPIVEIPEDHVLFRTFYSMDGEIIQVPNVGNGRAVGARIPGATTSERDGYVAHLRGIFDDSGRLMVAINWNTDLGDALEWAEDPNYPLSFSAFASRLFLNHIMYAMTH
jgi:hypothetical protein